jgi:peptidylprolyl isomerase domain and WD repeat-containing protein 1
MYVYVPAAVNLHTNRCSRILGKQENLRFLQLSLFQGKLHDIKGAPTIEAVASDNPILQKVVTDPTLVCTALKKNRFFLFTRRDPDDLNKGLVVVCVCVRMSYLFSLV